MVIVTVNGSKELCFVYAFYFFSFYFGGGVSYFFLFQNIYFRDNTLLINNTFLKNIIENILQLLISNLLFYLQKYCLDFTADFTKVQTYLYDVLIILLYSKYNRNHE